MSIFILGSAGVNEYTGPNPPPGPDSDLGPPGAAAPPGRGDPAAHGSKAAAGPAAAIHGGGSDAAAAALVDIQREIFLAHRLQQVYLAVQSGFRHACRDQFNRRPRCPVDIIHMPVFCIWNAAALYAAIKSLVELRCAVALP